MTGSQFNQACICAVLANHYHLDFDYSRMSYPRDLYIDNTIVNEYTKEEAIAYVEIYNLRSL